MKLTRRQRHFLELLYPDGTIAIGLTVGADLRLMGLVRIAKYGRYGITEAGAQAIGKSGGHQQKRKEP